MPRIRNTPPPAVNPVARPGWKTQERHYKLIAPLTGGGIKPTFPDLLTFVRGSEVRGQLRFWWRACRGASDAASEQERLTDMRAREAALWGMAALADDPAQSNVNIRIAVDDEGAEVDWDSADYFDAAYALFPLAPQQNHDHPQPSGVVREGITFRLWLTYPEADAAEVEAALWAWETFGGLGARTRRGCGALQCTAVDGVALSGPKTPGGVEQAIHAGLHRHLRHGTWPETTPYLSPQLVMKVTDAFPSATAAWVYMIGKLKAYRQQRRTPRGRSLWPEPDTIRQLQLWRYRTVLPAERHRLTMVQKFPRGQFGLPIVFQVYGDPVAGTYSVTLQGATEGRTRMASPLILRPIALAGEGACGVAVVLRQEGGYSPPGGTQLDGTTVDMSISGAELAQVQTDTEITVGPEHFRLQAGSDPVAYFVDSFL